LQTLQATAQQKANDFEPESLYDQDGLPT
jgi:hypothetical protein